MVTCIQTYIVVRSAEWNFLHIGFDKSCWFHLVIKNIRGIGEKHGKYLNEYQKQLCYWKKHTDRLVENAAGDTFNSNQG